MVEKIEKAENTEEAKEAKKELEETYRKFLRLYERFAEDRVTITKQGETLGKIIEELQAESSMATEFKHHVRSDLKEMIEDTVHNVFRSCCEELDRSVTCGVNSSIKKFQAAVEESTAVLEDYKNSKEINTWVICVGCFVFAIVLSVILVKWIMPMPIIPLTDSQFQTYESGQELEKFWSKIPKKEQQHLRDIGAGKIDPEVNSFEWIKQQHPTWSTKSIVEEFEEQGRQDEQREKQEQKKQQKRSEQEEREVRYEYH